MTYSIISGVGVALVLWYVGLDITQLKWWIAMFIITAMIAIPRIFNL